MERREEDEDSGDQDSSQFGGSSVDKPHQHLAVVDNQVKTAEHDGEEDGGEHYHHNNGAKVFWEVNDCQGPTNQLQHQEGQAQVLVEIDEFELDLDKGICV